MNDIIHDFDSGCECFNRVALKTISVVSLLTRTITINKTITITIFALTSIDDNFKFIVSVLQLRLVNIIVVRT